MTHWLKLIVPKIKWYFHGRRLVSFRVKDIERLLKETEMLYNEGYRKNPTKHEVLILRGKVDAYRELLYGRSKG
jgi:hypothetical protein